MKLRNKKTGGLANILADEQDFIRVYTDAGWHDYDSIAEMMEDWEDYKTAEPLIKDEKIRKAVRAWAEAIGEKDNLVVSKNMEYHDCCIYCGDFGNQALIDLNIDLNIDENSYTLTELCGEED